MNVKQYFKRVKRNLVILQDEDEYEMEKFYKLLEPFTSFLI